ncbi:hypothetical protein [Lactiplantibacillus pingfangensis]|uniref:hypothetical protein n=1 Tax=Lactiplantibacillus TaxID=2767842 RepID=UPI0010F61B3F|nr:hypothetical protein [Lactiplantibacillus pingfangensis]
MAYLTFDEYKQLGFTKITDKDTFNRHEQAAETQIDITTRFFYNVDLNHHDLTDDLTSDEPFAVFRAKQFKRAAALQCDYFDELGADTPVGIANNDLSSVEIGRTHLQKNASVSSTNYGKTGIATGVAAILVELGMMTRAVSYQ